MALLQSGSLTIASLGDSVGTLVRRDRTWTQVSEEHSTTRQDECLRIQSN